MSKPRKYPAGTEAVTVREAAAMLGISQYTLSNRIKDGTVPAFRIGKLIRVSRKTLDEIMEGEGNERKRNERSRVSR